MKVLVAGSREICDFDISEYIPSETSLIISGGAQGIDKIAEEFADIHKISKLILYPNYKKYGKAAPLIRNKEMIDIADTVVIIWNGKSRGTKFTLDYAKKQNKNINLIIKKS